MAEHVAVLASEEIYADELVGKPQSPTKRVLKRLMHNAAALVALFYLAAIVIVAVFADALAPHDFAAQGSEPFLGMSADHWLGTDELARDVLSRMMFAARESLRVALFGVGLAMVIAVPVGLFSGYRGGLADNVIQRVLDSIQSVPGLVLALVINALRVNDKNAVIWALAAVLVPGFIRLIRANSLAVAQETYIEASKSMGTPTPRILFKRVLPSVISPLIVQASMALGTGLVFEASLSFIGFGVKPPKASWGAMLNRGFNHIFNHPFQLVPPAVGIGLTVLAFNTFGDALRDAISHGGPTRQPKGTKRGRLGTTVVTRTEPKDPAIVPAGALLAVQNLTVGFAVDNKVHKVVDDVSFEVQPGQIVGLVGESGSGKTVTSQAVMRLIPSPPGQIMGGHVFFEGLDLLSMNHRQLREMRGKDFAMIFQDPLSSLNPAFTIGNQMVETMRLHADSSTAQARARSLELLERVGISEAPMRMKQYPHELSGGMRQRVLIAMALLNNPKLLIADEPTTALDVTVQAQILDLLKGLVRERNMAMVFVTHDLGVVADLCDRVMVMYAGQIVEQAPVHELYANPRHPYTKALLAAIPQASTGESRLVSIPGVVPVPGNWPIGCRFASRCAMTTPECSVAPVGLLQIGADRTSRCIHHARLPVPVKVAR